MELTRNHIGNVISFNKTGDCFIVDDITADSIYLRNETGVLYSSSNHPVDAFVITDPHRINQFNDNLALGTVLSAAKVSAMRKINGRVNNASEVKDAVSVLKMVNFHQHRLNENIQSNSKHMNRTHGKSLDEMINSASSLTSKQPIKPVTPFER